MDHRISKDMISSGMSYSGQKSKEDLARTQYGSAARPDALMEAYKNIYTEQTGPALPGEPGRPGTPKAPGGRPHLPGEKQTPAPNKKPSDSVKLQLAHADLFDIIKGHLMDEGLTEAAAIELMVSMTEEERNAVIDEMNAGPSTPVKYDSHMKQLVPNMGAGRPGKVRPKPGVLKGV